MDDAAEMDAPTGDPVAVANAAEAAIILAARGGLAGVESATRIVLDFAESGDVTVTVTTPDGEDSGVVSAADIASISDTEEDAETLGMSDTLPAPAG